MDKREQDKEPIGEPSAKKSRLTSEKKESSRIAHLLCRVFDSSTNNDAKEAFSQGDVRSLLRLAFRINQHEEIKELDEDEDEDYTLELEMEDGNEIEDKLEINPES
jgi:hypothetical protein